MAVGTQPSETGLNQSLTTFAVALRNLLQDVGNFTLQVQNMGTAGLEAVGFSPADAAAFLSACGYLSTIAGVYHGTVQQGGTGGTGATTFDFNNQLSALWAGQ